MKVLVVGGGGREHALAWKLSQSPKVKQLFCAPGNAGTEKFAKNIPVLATDIQELKKVAFREKMDLTVVGPELPLSHGIVDEFERIGLKCFGPYQLAAEIEGSKVFAKQFMDRHQIPTARFQVADSAEGAKKILQAGEFPYPVVLKADGLAAGKGVIVARNLRQAEKAVDEIMVERRFGTAGRMLLIEEFLRGYELSFIVLSDGTKVCPLVTAMDYKPVYDGGKGPNTGGMGAISPNPYIDRDTYNEIAKRIVFPTVTRMLEEGRKYKGVLYVGLMLTQEGPKVLEYNCRFGDPETQPQLLRLESDLVDLIQMVIEENVLEAEVKWSRKPSACVVAASGGYPLKYDKGKLIEGLDEAAKLKDIEIFHAGTAAKDGKCYTAGGRVLNVCSKADTLKEAMTNIYKALDVVTFDGVHFRRDIGAAPQEK
jgi:phosphoribosylamine--glycine ligase